jgi:hypothetical protein
MTLIALEPQSALLERGYFFVHICAVGPAVPEGRLVLRGNCDT